MTSPAPPSSPVDEAAVEATGKIAGYCGLKDKHFRERSIRIITDAYAEQGNKEKQRRIYYQTIVYKVCNLLDQGYTGSIVCGTIEEPSTECQDVVAARLTTEREAILNHLACINGDGGHRAAEFDSVLDAIKDATATHYERIEQRDREQFAEGAVLEKLVAVAERLEKLMIFRDWESQVQESGTISTDDPMPEVVLLPPLRTDVADALAAAKKLEDADV